MVFWGVEIAAGKPYHFAPSEDDDSQLHLSQATIGLDVKAKQRVVLKVKVGENPEILLCSLTSGLLESCPLDLVFEEDATFSVVGSGSIHLSGYFMPIIEEHHHGHDEDDEGDDDDEDDDLDLLEGEEDSEDYDSQEDEVYEGLDSDEDLEDEFLPPKKSTVVIEEITEEEDTKQGKAPEKENGSKATVAKGEKMKKKGKKEEVKEKGEGETEGELEEDEDGFLVPKRKRDAPEGEDKQIKKKKPAVEGHNEPNTKPEDKVEVKEVDQKVKEVTPEEKGNEKAKDKKKKKKEKKQNLEEKKPEEPKEVPVAKPKAPVEAPKKDEKKPKERAPTVRTFPNGLEVHEISLGKPNAKQATAGKRVFMLYRGVLKSNGKQFDSNLNTKKPFSFRLGVGEVIKGWDVGVQGMRVGDKRKLVIPPQMGYGARGAPGAIPPNAWLVFDVELVDVK